MRNFLQEICWYRERLTNIQAATRPNYLWPEILGWACGKQPNKKRDEQEWAIEKPKLDNARRLGGIYFIDPEDETMKNARRKLETLLEAAMPCKMGTRKRLKGATGNCSEWRHSPTQDNQVFLHERLKFVFWRNHDDHIGEKRVQLTDTLQFINFSSAPSDENSGCEGCSE